MISLLMYADDVQNMQLMLECLNTWCSKWRLSVNPEKTQVIHFRPKSKVKTMQQFSCGPHTLKVTSTYKYLGCWFEEHLDINLMAKLVAQAGSRALGKVITKFRQFGQDSYSCFKKLFESSVLPVIAYSAGIWGFKDLGVLCTAQNKACRFFLGVPTQTPNIATQGDMGWLSLSVACKLETVRLWSRLMNMNDNRIAKKIFTWSAHIAGPRYRNWNFMLADLLNSLDLGHLQRLALINSRFVLNMVKDRLSVKGHNLWFDNLWNDVNKPNGNKLRTYRTFKTELRAESYLLLNISRFQRRNLARLRHGVLPLAIETGRYSKPKTPLEQRLCKLCTANTIESEVHFLIQCPLYQDQRVLLIEYATKLNSQFPTLNDADKFVFLIMLMKEEKLQKCLCKTVDNMFACRQIFTSK